MSNRTFNPYWAQAKQHQEKLKGQSQGQAKRTKNDFSHEYNGQFVDVMMHDGSIIRGRLLDATRFWFKLETDGRVVYVNKGYVAMVKPQVKEEGKAAPEVAGNGQVRN